MVMTSVSSSASGVVGANQTTDVVSQMLESARLQQLQQQQQQQLLAQQQQQQQHIIQQAHQAFLRFVLRQPCYSLAVVNAHCKT